jgi:hypothetical protein
MDNVNPILLVSLTCCIGPLLFGGTCFTVGRWSTRWRLTLNRRSYAETQAHSEAVGYGDSAGLPPQAPPPAMPEQRRRKQIRRVQQGAARASSTRTVSAE